MKSSIKLIASLIAAGFPCVAFAEVLGASVPSALNLSNTLGFSAAAFITLMMLNDYSRRSRFSVAAANTAAFNDEKHRLAA